jgi:hypothetical protein
VSLDAIESWAVSITGVFGLIAEIKGAQAAAFPDRKQSWVSNVPGPANACF